MAIELAKIQLNRVHKIATLEQAALVYHRVPGLEGNVVQELGRDSVRLQIEGIFYGAKAKDDLEALRKVYKQRQPVDFLAEIVGQAYFSQVTLERFEVRQLADYPEQFSYSLIVAEYVAPPKSAVADTAAVDAAIKRDAQNFMNVAMLPDSLTPGSIPNLTNPVAPLKGALSPVGEATQNLGTATGGLKSLFDPVELPAPPELSSEVGKVPETPLDWGESSGTGEDLGVPLPVAPTDKQPTAPGDITPTQPPTTDEPPTAPGQQEAPTSWAIFELVDEQGNPVAGARYVVSLGDRIIQQGELNQQGQARIEELEAGTYTITFPDLDADEWEVTALTDTSATPVGDLPPSLGEGTQETQPTPTQPTEAEPTGDTEEEAPTGWAILELVDEQGTPVAGVGYVVILPDGTTRTGQLNQQGQARIEGIATGTYTITFPDLEANEWEVTGLTELPQREPTETEAGEQKEAETQTDWVVLELVDEEGNPVAGARYVVTVGDRIIQQGELNQQGQARLSGIEVGTYTITFPDLDANDWDVV